MAACRSKLQRISAAYGRKINIWPRIARVGTAESTGKLTATTLTGGRSTLALA